MEMPEHYVNIFKVIDIDVNGVRTDFTYCSSVSIVYFELVKPDEDINFLFYFTFILMVPQS